MKILYKLLITFFIISMGITSTGAVDFVSKENVKITGENKGDLAVAGARVDIESQIDHDLMVTAGELRIEETIAQDLIFAAGEVRIEEKIGDDIRGIAGLVIIENDVEGDVILAGGDVRVKKEATIKGDLIIASGRLEIDGNVLGNVKMLGEELELNGVIHGDANIILDKFSNTTQSGTILGSLTYRAEDKITILEESTIGTVTYEPAVFREQLKKDAKDILFSTIILKILFVFVFSTFMYFFFIKFFKRASEILTQNTGKSFLYGLLTIILVPVFIILFFISVIGIPVGLLLMFWYILLLMFLNVINVTVLSSWLVEKYKIFKNVYLSVLLILILSIIFVLINGLALIVGFFTIGTVIILKKEILETIRNQYK